MKDKIKIVLPYIIIIIVVLFIKAFIVTPIKVNGESMYPTLQEKDIMILNNPVAVSDEENRGREYETIVLFELKRPMRNDYNSGSNPVNQLYEYVTKLKGNNVKDKDGRIIRVGDNTQFYLYAVCDITSTLEQVLTFHDFTQTPDKMGYYRYHEKMNAYIEILSYDKIISDAQKRNKILFDKLGI